MKLPNIDIFSKKENINKIHFTQIRSAAVTLTHTCMIYLTFYHHRRWVYCVTAVVKGTDKTTRRMIFIDGKKGNIVLLRANKSPLLRRRDLLSSFLEFVHALSGSSFCRISLWLFLQPSLRPGCLFRTVLLRDAEGRSREGN